jgi:hypothetical protein
MSESPTGTKLHAEAVLPRLPALRAGAIEESRRQKGLFAWLDDAGDVNRLESGEAQFVTHLARFDVLERQWRATFFSPLRSTVAPAGALVIFTRPGRNSKAAVDGFALVL